MDRSTGDADKAMKRNGDAAATAAATGRTRPRVKSTLARFPMLPRVCAEPLDRVKTLENNVYYLATVLVRKDMEAEEKNLSMSSYADSCDSVEKDVQIEKLKAVVEQLTK